MRATTVTAPSIPTPTGDAVDGEQLMRLMRLMRSVAIYPKRRLGQPKTPSGKIHAAENRSLLRRIALDLMRHGTSLEVGVKTRRLRANRDGQYLLEALTTPM